MSFLNVVTKQEWAELPQSKKYADGSIKTGGTTLADWQGDGWRNYLGRETPAPDMHVLSWKIQDDGTDARYLIDQQITEEEWQQQQAEEAARQEAERQAAKPLKLKTCENNFLIWCDTLTGGTSHTKLGFDEIKAIIATLQPEQQVMLAAQLQAVNS